MWRRHYIRKNIRALMIEGFDRDELRSLIFDEPKFRLIYEKGGEGIDKRQMVQDTIEYCDRKGLLDELLDHLRELNSMAYARFEPYYYHTIPSCRNKKPDKIVIFSTNLLLSLLFIFSTTWKVFQFLPGFQLPIWPEFIWLTFSIEGILFVVLLFLGAKLPYKLGDIFLFVFLLASFLDSLVFGWWLSVFQITT